MLSKAIAQGDSKVLNYFVATKYVEALEQLATSSNQKTLILPIEATSILGSLAGIKEMFAASQEQKSDDIKDTTQD